MQLEITQRAALFAGLVLVSVAARAQSTPKFAAPVQLEAGDALLGVDRYYPSPMVHDVDGDGLRDIAVGDLRGRITIALRERGDGPAKFGKETVLKGVDGKDLDFHNW
jgi:hypothetical protein